MPRRFSQLFDATEEEISKIYAGAVEMYPFPQNVYFKPISALHVAMESTQAMQPNHRLPKTFAELTEKQKQTFAIEFLICSSNLSKLRNHIATKQIELTRKEKYFLSHASKYYEGKILSGSDLYDTKHLHKHFMQINGVAWSQYQIVNELQKIAKLASFTKFDELQDSRGGLQTVFWGIQSSGNLA